MSPLDGFRPDPKPVPTVGGMGLPKGKSPRRAMTVRREEIRAERVGPCIVCRLLQTPQELPSTLHHIVAKSIGGYDGEWHEASVCGDGTTGHHGLIEAHDHDVCRAFAVALQLFERETYEQAIAELGRDRFNRRYKVNAKAAA